MEVLTQIWSTYKWTRMRGLKTIIASDAPTQAGHTRSSTQKPRFTNLGGTLSGLVELGLL